MSFTLQLAQHNVLVHNLFSETETFCADYLSDDPPDFSLMILPEDILRERQISTQADLSAGVSVRHYPDAYLETLALQRKITTAFFEYNILLFHGSAVAVDGEAYLFTAKSGTGKSTHTRLWREYFGSRAIMVNDDKPFLQITPEGIYVCGSPWNGKHGLGENIRVPLKSICIIQRGSENTIHRISPSESLMVLLQQSWRPREQEQLRRYMDLMDLLLQKIPMYRLQCNMELQAAQTAYLGMNQ